MAPPPFVGRISEVSNTVDLVDRCRMTSRPGAAIVRGEMGAGKSRLLDEVRGRLSAVTVLTVTGYQPEANVPLAAAQDLLRALGKDEHEGPRLEALLDGATSAPQHPVQVFEAARRCLPANASPVVMVIDDLQWVDDVSSALAHYLLRAARDEAVPLVVLAATRPGSRSGAFATSVARLLDEPGQLLTIELDPLDRSDARALVRRLQPQLDDAAVDEVADRSGGVPFWLTEGAYAAPHQSDTQDVAGSRLAGVSVDGMSMAAALAIAAAPADLELVTRMLRWPGSRSSVAADELVDRGVVTRTGTVVRFVHDLVKEAVLAGLPDDLTQQLHRGLADDLQRDDRGDVRVLRRALAHRRAAGEPGADVALRVLGARDRRLLAAADLRELAGIADAQMAVYPDTAHELLRRVAQVASEIGRPDLALEEWTSLALRADTAELRAYAALHASVAAMEGGDRSQAEALLEQCRVPGRLAPAVEILRAAHESELRATSTSASEAPMRRAADLARTLAREAGDPTALHGDDRRAYLAAMQAEYYFALRTQRPATMLKLADELTTSADTTEGRLRGTLHRVLGLRLLGRYVAAERTCRAVRLAAVREQLPAVTFLSGYLLARCLHSLGRLDLARAAAADVAALADRAPVVVPSWLSAAWIRSLVHEIDVSLVGWSTARPALQQLVQAEPNPHFRLHIEMAGAVWAARLGGPRGGHVALGYADAAAEDARRAECTRCAAELALRSAEVHARVGRPEAATVVLRGWDAEHTNPEGEDLLLRSHAAGLVAWHHDPVESTALLQQAADEAGRMHAELQQLWCQLDLGRALGQADHQRSVHVLRQAATAANRLGAQSEQRRALQLLRAIGVRAWRPGRSAPQAQDGLTERELAIAEMVCDGASNPEIAETLFLSRKTIERHVSNVLAKTGVRNRAELAANLAKGRAS